VCGIVGALLRQALIVAMVVVLLAGAGELLLRATGVRPQPPVELSNVIPDAWTGFRLRPGVAGQEPYVTNDLGMHAPRSYALVPPPGTLRVAVLGSSVVYGMNLSFADTIPAVVERELRAAGRPAEVLNFGTHAYSIVNVSALLQTYVHQLQPDAVVVVVDLQVALARWPAVHPLTTPEEQGIETLSGWKALVTRGSEKSALLGVLANPRPARRWIRRTTGLPLRPSRPRAKPRRTAEPEATADAPAPLAGPTVAAPPESIAAYEQRRERELAAPMAAMAAFAAEKGIDLYFVTPYGPYFDLTEGELAEMSVHHFLEEAAPVYGGERAAIGAEVELITRVIRRVSDGATARVIDMLEASRRSSLRSSTHFTVDGVHLSPAGNAVFGRLIAERILQDLDRRPADES
jgi:hypothetical protein